jgi:hypothetical protein
MNTIRKRKKMNAIKGERLDLEILKVLLPSKVDAIYKIPDELKAKGISSIYATVRRHVIKLSEHGYITIEKNKSLKKNRLVDNRGNATLLLSFKGLFKLLLDADLSEAELRLVVDKSRNSIVKAKNTLTESKPVNDISINALRQSIGEMRSRINLQYYNEDYAIQLFYENAIMKNCLDEFVRMKEEIKKLRSQKKVTPEEANKILLNLPTDFIDNFINLYDYMKDQRRIWTFKIKLLRPYVIYLRKQRAHRRRVHPN